MLMAAMASASVSVWLGLVAGIGASLIFALIHGAASITFRGNQLIAGVALNFVAAGITVLIAQDVFGQGGRTPALEGPARFLPIDLPLAETLRGIPVLGPLYADVISGHSILVYVAVIMVPITAYIL